MKIKRLKIRNIASIESGDIDFEKGLIDQETGTPSPLFLITGDTGSGKSVILDCISMSLYGTTPRVKSVNGVKNNVFKNNEGQEISVSNINQYTRIGITAKDECFSELTFIGNDGIEYTSRFSLGKTRQKNLRKPEWTLIANGTDIGETKKKDVAERIEKAVGLTFEQFSRMAMLAQGQFATFLTGGKEEREVILEQLTATGIFSKYGDAIANIFKNAKKDKELSESLFEEFGKQILSAELRQSLSAKQTEMADQASICRSQADKMRNRIEWTENILKAEKQILNLKTIANKLRESEDSSEFRKRTTLINLWDTTSSQRELLSDKIKATEKVKSGYNTLQNKKYESTILVADLQTRRESAKTRTYQLNEKRNWIESQLPLRQLYSDSAGIIEKIDRYLSIRKDIEKKEKEAEKESLAILELQKSIASGEEEVKAKEKKCSECHIMITQHSAEREALNPTALQQERDTVSKRLFDLNELSAKVTSFETDKEEMEKAEKETALISKQLSELKVIADKAMIECSEIAKEKETAENRYRTMLLSVDEKFTSLRHRLAQEHATNCPLCGQSIAKHIHEWANKEYFHVLLSPLEEETRKISDSYALAKKDADEAIKRLNTTDGSLKAKVEDLKNRKNRIDKTEKVISEKLKALHIDSSVDLKNYIIEEISKSDSKIKKVSECLNKTETLQKEINMLLKQKELLDKYHKDADKKLQKDLEKLALRKESSKSLTNRIKELKEESERLTEEISGKLKGYADNWSDSPSSTASTLKKDADRYVETTETYAKEESEHSALCKVLDSLSSMKEKLDQLLSSIAVNNIPMKTNELKSLTAEELEERWSALNIEVLTVINSVSENESKIKSLDEELNKYYIETGRTETTLRELLGASEEIIRIREELDKHKSKLQQIATLLSENVKIKEENLKALEIEEESQLEDTEKLRSQLSELDKRHAELVQSIGAIKQRLEADTKTRMQSEMLREELVKKTLRYEKWEKMNRYFGGTRFRTLVQSHILRPLLNNANIYLRQITDHYTLTCSDENEQLSILVLDRYHNNEPRSVTVLSGGERFMISLALSLALSAMNRPDLNVDILFIDEGFGTLDAKSLEMVMSTLRRLPEINGQTGRRVGVISHREELAEQIPTQIQLHRSGEGRSRIVISNS